MADDLAKAKKLCGLTDGFRSDIVLVCIDLEQVDRGDFKGQVSEVGISTLDLRWSLGILGEPRSNIHYADAMTQLIKRHHFVVEEHKAHKNRWPPGCQWKFNQVSFFAPFLCHVTDDCLVG